MGTPRPFWTYIVPSGKNDTVYIGHTDNLSERVWRHQTKAFKGFTAKYDCNQLVWCEAFNTREEAFARERQLKPWRRARKVTLIKKTNPEWKDLSIGMNMWARRQIARLVPRRSFKRVRRPR